MDGERCDLARIPLIFRGGGRVPALHRLRILLRPAAPSGVVPARPAWLWMAGAAVCLSPRLTAAAVCASQIPRQYHPRLAAVAHAEPFRPIRPRSETVVDHQHPVPLSRVISAARPRCATPVQLLPRPEGRFPRPSPCPAGSAMSFAAVPVPSPIAAWSKTSRGRYRFLLCSYAHLAPPGHKRVQLSGRHSFDAILFAVRHHQLNEL